MNPHLLGLLLALGFIALVIGFAKLFIMSDTVATAKKPCKHLFDADEVINLKIDPKCTKCKKPLSKLQ